MYKFVTLPSSFPLQSQIQPQRLQFNICPECKEAVATLDLVLNNKDAQHEAIKLVTSACQYMPDGVAGVCKGGCMSVWWLSGDYLPHWCCHTLV